MATQIQLRRDTQANWSSANTVLALGEIGYATDLYKFKIGDGSTAWNSLAYQGYTLVADDSTGTLISNADDFKIAGGDSVSTSISGNTLTIDLDETITVDAISSTDSSAIQINDGLNVSGTLSADTIDTNAISSTDSSAIQINDAVNISGTLSVNTIDVNTITSGDSSGININDTNLYVNQQQVFARNQAGDIDLTNANSDISQFIVNASGTFTRIAAANINVSSFNNDAGYATATGGGFINSTLTSFPTAGDSTALDFSESSNSSEPAGVGTGAGDTTDAFGVALGATFDNMEPVGRSESSDFGDGEAYVGA